MGIPFMSMDTTRIKGNNMLSFTEYLKEHLTPFEQRMVDDKKLDTSTGEEISSHVIPKGQHHTEIPLVDHFHNDVKEYVNGLNVPHRENNDPKGKMIQGKYKFLSKHELLHPTGSKRTVLSVIRDNPTLLKKYNDMNSASQGKIDGEGINVIVDGDVGCNSGGSSVYIMFSPFTFLLSARFIFGGLLIILGV